MTLIWNGVFSSAKANQKVPHYRIQIHYQKDQRLLKGKMQVRFNPDQYPAGELMFSLPMNRFKNLDDRGLRRNRLTTIFSSPNNQKWEQDDPQFPVGFSRGETSILSVHDHQGKSLEFHLEPNLALEVGYSVMDGLLKILVPAKIQHPELNIEFTTLLPEHTLEGGLNQNLISIHWYPKLLVWNHKKWLIDENTPSQGTYELNWSASETGTLITSFSTHQDIKPNRVISIKAIDKPVKSLPIIFSDQYVRYKSESKKNSEKRGNLANSAPDPSTPIIESFHFKGYEKRAKLFHSWVELFLKFVQKEYGLKKPWDRVHIVTIDANYEQIQVINNLVLVPLPNYKRSFFFDRRALSLVSLSLGKLWFGEKVWAHRDTGMWLSKGVPVFLSLRFFENQYGPNAGIWDFIDWMNPRFRDHFIEDMALQRTPKNYKDPILSSFQNSSNPKIYLEKVTYKTAMVLSMLEHMIGKDSFAVGLQKFIEASNNQVAALEEFQEVFNKEYNNKTRLFKKSVNYIPEENLDWFFNQWFRDTVDIDYELGDLLTEQMENGNYRTQVVIKKLKKGWMPVEVRLILEDGTEIEQIVNGKDPMETVIFETKSPADKVSLDPEEKLLESKRINNHSFQFHRVRFAFGLKKRREHLWLLVPGVQSNAIDGNSYGISVRYGIEDYQVYAIPGYGTKNDRLLYLIKLDRDNLGIKNLGVGITIKEEAGIRSEGLRLKYSKPPERGNLSYKFNTEIRRELLFVARKNAKEGDFKETGNNNVFSMSYNLNIPLNDYYRLNWAFINEQPSHELETDFSYSKNLFNVIQSVYVGHRKWFELGFIYGSIGGSPPLQKKFALGSPGTLRGFPQTVDLYDDNMMVSSLDFKFPILYTSLWSDLSAKNIQGVIFYDQGKGWSNFEQINQTRLRKNFGWGILWITDAATLSQFPLKFEVGYPLDDPDYDQPHYIFLGTLSW